MLPNRRKNPSARIKLRTGDNPNGGHDSPLKRSLKTLRKRHSEEPGVYVYLLSIAWDPFSRIPCGTKIKWRHHSISTLIKCRYHSEVPEVEPLEPRWEDSNTFESNPRHGSPLTYTHPMAKRKIAIFKRRYIFKWLVFHCHVSFPG